MRHSHKIATTWVSKAWCVARSLTGSETQTTNAMQPHTERRSEKRHAANLRATVVYDEGVSRLDARIVDLSRAGARLELPWPASLPRHFYMLGPEHQLRHCAVVWQAERLVGILFGPAKGQPATAAMDTLRPI